MEAIILAGGQGTRLKSVVSDVPKPMAPINNRPFLSYILDHLNNQEFSKIILAVGYKKEIIQEYYQNRYKNLIIEYSIEDIPLGTGGAIKKSLNHVINSEVFIINGDTFFPINYKHMLSQHHNTQADLTIAVKMMENFDRYGTVISDNTGRIISFEEKKAVSQGKINAGAYLIKTEKLLSTDLPVTFSFEKDYLEKYIQEYLFYEFISKEYFIDIGIPEDYLEFNKITVKMPHEY